MRDPKQHQNQNDIKQLAKKRPQAPALRSLVVLPAPKVKLWSYNSKFAARPSVRD